ncbi:ribosome biogenesis GTPase Der [Hippea maritima]|uniref:GTPase Der n=1 Tax=Hippea maritima (strain ATCC 700847 / DSM 10411 / MH2) TaxID=760142 RepID=F2LXC3_HIPMA|nr:ribosome biogenesis GTPase Der [Hippea maritima]AEA34237.1 GTP-binding protein engA [Hippea maritima DSM 10411]
MAKVAIVGKPNVGKSTLFNALVKKNKSLILDMPGTTRDRIFEYGKIDDKDVLFIDTGGFETEGEFSQNINEQIKLAIDSSDAVIVVFDLTTPLSIQDEEIFKYVVKSKKPYILTANKSDIKKQEFEYDYYKFGDILKISAAHKRNLNTLKEKLGSLINEVEKRADCLAKIAITGRSNVGKSSLINAILGENRSVVSDKIGTTTDSIDTPFIYNSNCYLLIDTAGIRKKAKTKKAIDKLSSIFSFFAIDRSDICVFLIDAKEGLTSTDKFIIDKIIEKNKGLIIALNKWDLVKNTPFSEYEKLLKEHLPFAWFAEFMPISAIEVKNIGKLLKKIESVEKICSRRIPTHELNEKLHTIIRQNAPFSKKGKEVKLKYITQVDTNPPHFVIFTNRPEDIEENYKRYVRNSMYKLFNFKGCSIKITYRSSKNEPDIGED